MSLEAKIKRDRKKNFSTDEIRILREEFETHQETLTSKFSNTVTNEKKKNIWKNVTEKINSLGIEFRNVDEVKIKWKNLCSNAKQMYNELKRERVKTGGGPAPKPINEETDHNLLW